MRRWFWNLATGFSAILCILFIALWIVSYFREDNLAWIMANGPMNRVGPNSEPGYRFQIFDLLSTSGRISADFCRFQIEGKGWEVFVTMQDSKLAIGWHWNDMMPHAADSLPAPSLRNGFGFYAEHDLGEGELSLGEIRGGGPRKPGMTWGITRTQTIAVPYWALVLLTGFGPVRWLMRRRKRRAAAGRCAVCNYNLTGNVSGICPECGTAIKQPPNDLASQAKL